MAEEKQYPLLYFIHNVFTLAQNDLLYHRQDFTSRHRILKHNCPINLKGTVVPMTEVMILALKTHSWIHGS